MSHHRLEFDCICTKCNGTGLYVGRGERDGAAVVCHACDKGKVHRVIEYDDYEGQVKRDDVRRVLKANPGICVGENKEEGLKLEDFGGMPYEDWFAGMGFPPKSEMRNYTCPSWWCQCAGKPSIRFKDRCSGIGMFCKCSHFDDKATCWAMYDRGEGRR